MGHNGLHAGGVHWRGNNISTARALWFFTHAKGALVYIVQCWYGRYSYSVHIGACRTGGERRFHVDTDTVTQASRALQRAQWELLRHKIKPWGVALQRTSNWGHSTTQSACTGPSHPAVRDPLTGGHHDDERGFAWWGLEGHPNSPMGPRRIKSNSFPSPLKWAMQLRRQNSGII